MYFMYELGTVSNFSMNSIHKHFFKAWQSAVGTVSTGEHNSNRTRQCF